MAILLNLDWGTCVLAAHLIAEEETGTETVPGIGRATRSSGGLWLHTYGSGLEVRVSVVSKVNECICVAQKFRGILVLI